MRDFSKLRGKIKEKLGNDYKLAELLNLSESSISGKLNDKIPFSLLEIEKIISILDIPTDKIYEYFFTHIVEK